jgi:hypothetical protein
VAQVWVLAHEFHRLWYADEYKGHGPTFELPTVLLVCAGLHLFHNIISRLYLGAHFLADIVGGLVCGMATISQANFLFYGKSSPGGGDISHDEWWVSSGAGGWLSHLVASVPSPLLAG